MSAACPYIPKAQDPYEGFAELSSGEVRLLGIPDQTLKKITSWVSGRCASRPLQPAY